MGQQQTNPQQRDRDERSGEETTRRTGASADASLPDSAMGTGNDDPIDNWSTLGAAGTASIGAGSNVTSGRNDRTDEIGALTDGDDPSDGNSVGFDSTDRHHHGADKRAFTIPQKPRNSE